MFDSTLYCSDGYTGGPRARYSSISRGWRGECFLSELSKPAACMTFKNVMMRIEYICIHVPLYCKPKHSSNLLLKAFSGQHVVLSVYSHAISISHTYCCTSQLGLGCARNLYNKKNYQSLKSNIKSYNEVRGFTHACIP